MRVRILSGQHAGGIQELSQVEGEVAVATGYGESVVDDAPSAAASPAPEPSEEPASPAPESPVDPSAEPGQ